MKFRFVQDTDRLSVALPFGGMGEPPASSDVAGV
jgi:hypothetical protein